MIDLHVHTTASDGQYIPSQIIQKAAEKNSIIEKLSEKYQFEVWEPGDQETVIRFVCSWATKKEDVDQLLSDVRNLIK